MKRRADLIDLFSDVVIGADDPRRLAERTLEVVCSLSSGHSGAVFTCTDPSGGVNLFASRGINQAVLDVVPVVWEARGGALRQGETVYVADRANERRIRPPPDDASGPASFAVVPVFDDETLVALAVRVGTTRLIDNCVLPSNSEENISKS